MKKIFGLAITISLMATLLLTGMAFGAATKVAVCHVDEQGVYNLITISENAFPAHVDHGDSSPGDQYPAMPGYVFSAECTPEINLTGNWSGRSGLIGNLAYTFNMSLFQASDGSVTGTITYYGGSTAVRNVTGNLVGTILTITTADASYSATVSGTATGTHFYGTGTGTPVTQLVALEAWR